MNKVSEGTVFTINLPDSTAMTGLVSRRWGAGIYCYFFDITLRSLASESLLCLNIQEAIASLDTGYQGFKALPSVWKILGEYPNFDRNFWAPPPRYRIDPINKIAYRVECIDHDPHKILAEWPEPLRRGLASIGVVNYGGVPSLLIEMRRRRGIEQKEWWEKCRP